MSEFAIERTLEDKVWIQPEDFIDDEFHGKNRVTPGGIALPDNYDDKQNKTRCGIVKAVGDGWYDFAGVLHPLCVKVGERVLFMKYKGQDAEVDGVKYIVVSYKEILAVLHPVAKPNLTAV
jgi:chaperonin GroES